MEYIKKMLKSKTVWAGIIQIVTSLSLFFTGEQSANELLFGASGVLMILFRIITTESIGAKK
jgi:hypothetical protein